ncbi:uncharacterized protein LY89DRAFT_700787 [Mollisia scopiformis]|uniref:Atos-like conserved domain-containing protein n=1 Tax=Mollisia scopiformis TaxID=149040 RepID=A0A132BE31_MOLSC|nr:uncharacterized protein LY89DRAFT_700787 [Mollisia scopiformis]KUJ10259.1 hypothetical protein LY89DRAFT_700787 [Mollisia scopiformis]
MPIFQDDLGGGQDTPPTKPPSRRSTSPVDGNLLTRKLSEDSIRTDLCEGPLRESLEEESNMPTIDVESRPRTPGFGTSDRVELIERLKRGESPTWLPNRNLESLLHDYEQTPRKPSSNGSHSSPLLPPAEISEKPRSAGNQEDRHQAGLQIERPRSALHSGDFTEARETASERDLLQPNSTPYRDEQAAWIATSPPRHFTPYQLDPRFPPADSIERARSRAPSLSSSYSSSFILKPPTSPLVQSESNEELDLSSQVNPIDITSSFPKNPRRHTLQAPHSIHSTPSGPSSPFNSKPLPHLRRDNTYPYQAHQPRRSLTLNPMTLPTSSPQTPAFLHSRRPSIDSSPLHASMVGSYEESILRGRMSTTPSKPLDFVAQIGVLGHGKCKASLRCPAHVTLPFPAVFYSYESTVHGRSGKSEDGPSPYVGQVDLENGLPNSDEARDKKKRSANLGRIRTDDLDMVDGPNTNQLTEREIRRAEKQKRRSTSPRAPPGGSYRIPEKGQIQIIIKNPNKTAVKLFLVPYNLEGMEPGTKTFIRQRSYSAGPIIDSALSSTQQVPATNPLDRPTLRYLVHLHICSPSRGRFYLYKSIRVVFANRVPDGKEKLRNEISLPEPRFSIYKPGRDSSLGLTLGMGAGASLAAEKAFRRRSSGFGLGPSNRNFDSMDGITQALERGFGGGSSSTHGRDFSTTPVQPIPFSLYRKPVRGEYESDHASVQEPSMPSAENIDIHPSQDSGSSMSWNSTSTGIGAYDKLTKGERGYGGNSFANSPDGKQVAEGLLAQRLRDLGVGILNPQDQSDGI